MSARTNSERYQRGIAKLAGEIITNLAQQLGTDLTITGEITATNPNGFDDTVIRTVSENATTLKLDQHSFERS